MCTKGRIDPLKVVEPGLPDPAGNERDRLSWSAGNEVVKGGKEEGDGWTCMHVRSRSILGGQYASQDNRQQRTVFSLERS